MKKRRGKGRNIKEYAKVAFLSLVIVWLLWLLFGIVRKEQIARHTVADTKGELIALASRKSVLEGNIEELKTPRGEEATYRDTYGVAKPGEGVIIVVPPKEATTTPLLPWWRVWLEKIGF